MLNLQTLKDQFSENIPEAYLDKGQAVVVVQVDKVYDVLRFCRESDLFKMNMLLDIVGVDYLEAVPRFEVVYILYSLSLKERMRIKVRLGEEQSLPTAMDIWKSADWAEREVWDMFGIKFSGHPNLKRILLFEAFEGHPLRKDYPVNRRQPIPKIEESL